MDSPKHQAQHPNRTYRGTYTRDNKIVVEYRIDGHEDWVPLWHYRCHSESFAWGYSGSGPADLALAILANYFGERPEKESPKTGQLMSWLLHEPFMKGVVATWPKFFQPNSQWRIESEASIAPWVAGWMALNPEIFALPEEQEQSATAAH